ncbi:aspartyl protease family protein [uncultured Fibrobacter sp.]|uniref:aspartyl protease family protein n=1 Tax=uncultured Fibrobacter sp. TaxID=261512 RepID=UPI0025F2C90B|nr:aspartyl protease family protein [uncultured Fibrobacter sp.]
MSSFTAPCPGIVNKLKCWVGIKDPSMSKGDVFVALWDTGATNSAVTEKVAKALGLVPAGKTKVHGVNGLSEANFYVVEIILPGNMHFVRNVTECKSAGDWDVLVGMDIMSFGDFSVSNFNGSTTFSFRVPSRAVIDYVAEERAAVAAAQAANPPAPPEGQNS